MRTTPSRSAGLLLLLATAVGCGPPGLNGGQVDYLREDTLARAKAPSMLSVMAVGVAFIVEDGTLDPALSRLENLQRVHDRIETVAPGCVTWDVWPPDAQAQYMQTSGSLRGATCAQAGLASSGGLGVEVEKTGWGELVVTFSFGDLQTGPQVARGLVRLRTTTGQGPFMLEAHVSMNGGFPYGLVFNGTARADAAREWVELDGTGTEGGEGRVELPYRMEGVRHRVGGCAAEAGVFTLGPREVRVTEKDSRSINQTVRYGARTPSTGEVELTLGDEALTASYELPIACRP